MHILILSDAQTRNIKPINGAYAAFHKNGTTYRESLEPRSPELFEVPTDIEVLQIVLDGWTLQEGWTSEVQEIVYRKCNEQGWEPNSIDVVFLLGGFSELRGNLRIKNSETELQNLRNELIRNVEGILQQIEMKSSYQSIKFYLGAGAMWYDSSYYNREINSDLVQSKFRNIAIFNKEVALRSRRWRKMNSRLKFWNVFAILGNLNIQNEFGHLNWSGQMRIAQEIEELLVMVNGTENQ